jgi:hypothetical protein
LSPSVALGVIGLSEGNEHRSASEYGGVPSTAILQGGKRCIWPGCGRTLGIQVDHTADWQHLGVTAPHNSDILCNTHNPFKNNGYRITRDERGYWHTHRPDGTEFHPI